MHLYCDKLGDANVAIEHLRKCIEYTVKIKLSENNWKGIKSKNVLLLTMNVIECINIRGG